MTFASQLLTAFTPIAAVYDSASITRALSWAQSFVESYCNKTFDATSQTVFLDPQRYRTALLPQVPVSNIESVQALLPSATGGPMTWTTLTNWAYVAETGLIYDTTGQPGTTWELGTSWPRLPGSLQVTYDYGYSTVPQSLIDASCRFAQQYLENPTLQMQRRTGDSEGRFAGSAGIVINQLDKTILDRYTDIGIA